MTSSVMFLFVCFRCDEGPRLSQLHMFGSGLQQRRSSQASGICLISFIGTLSFEFIHLHFLEEMELWSVIQYLMSNVHVCQLLMASKHVIGIYSEALFAPLSHFFFLSVKSSWTHFDISKYTPQTAYAINYVQIVM